MRDDLAFFRALAIGGILWLAGLRVVAQEPTPPPLVTPHIECQDSYKLGERIEIEFLGDTPPEAKLTLAWRFPEHLDVESFNDGARNLAWTTEPGNYTAELEVTYNITVLTPGPEFPAKPEDIKTTVLPIRLPLLERTFTVGAPKPIPPPPDPDPDPTPPPVAGKRTLVIVYETGDSTPALSRLRNTLRTGTNASYLISKGHSLLILDDEMEDGAGQPLKIIQDVITLGDALPCLAILDSNTGAVLHHRPLSQDVNAAGVLQVLKDNGG